METEKNREDKKSGSGEYFENLLNRKPYRLGAIHCCALDFTNLGDEADDSEVINRQTDKEEEAGLSPDGGSDK